MNFTTGATIYQNIKNISEHINDYNQNIDSLDQSSATSRLIQNEIVKLDKDFHRFMQERYVLKSDFERRQLELYEEINLLKKINDQLKNHVNKHCDIKNDDEP